MNASQAQKCLICEANNYLKRPVHPHQFAGH